MIWQWAVWTLGLSALAFIAQRERMKRDLLAAAVVDAHKWIDEIIEALRNPDEDQGNQSLDRLVAEFDDDERPVSPEHKALGS